MGANNGSGCAMWFRCSKCRRGKNVEDGRIGSVRLTGRTRQSRRLGGARMTNTLREYRCLDCGFIGWSRHRDLERRAVALAAHEGVR